jgi:DNA-directed RNA polymerase specialized sigma24 family protein
MAARLRTRAPYVGRICGAIALDEGDDAVQETMIRVLNTSAPCASPPPCAGGCDASPWVRRSGWHRRDVRWSPSSTSRSDLRRVRLELTHHAERLLAALDDRSAARFAAILGQLSPQGRHSLAMAPGRAAPVAARRH